jgi:hypothetical protein
MTVDELESRMSLDEWWEWTHTLMAENKAHADAQRKAEASRKGAAPRRRR